MPIIASEFGDIWYPHGKAHQVRAILEVANDEGTIQATHMIEVFPDDPKMHRTTNLADALAAVGAEVDYDE